MFESIRRRIRNIEKANINPMLQALFERPEVAGLVLDLNTEGQLFLGIDSTGERLADIGGAYSPVTVRIKQEQGQPTDRVTLKDTGDFYRSFDLVAGPKAIIITADSIKGGVDLQIRWGDALLGLTPESKQEIIDYLLPDIRKMLLQKIHGS